MRTSRFAPWIVVAAIAAVFVGVAVLSLLRDVDARTATATWSCGSVVRPVAVGTPPADTPADSQLFFLSGSAACAHARDRQLGRALSQLLPAAIFGATAAYTRSAGRRARVASEPLA